MKLGLCHRVLAYQPPSRSATNRQVRCKKQAAEGRRGTYPGKECEKRNVAIAIAGGSNPDGGDDDQHQLDTIEPRPPVPVGEIAEQQLAQDRASIPSQLGCHTQAEFLGDEVRLTRRA